MNKQKPKYPELHNAYKSLNKKKKFVRIKCPHCGKSHIVNREEI